MSISIIDMVQKAYCDIDIESAVCKNLPQNTFTSIQVSSCNYNFFGSELKAAKVICLQVSGSSLIDSIIQKIWKFMQQLLKCLGFSVSIKSYNVDLIADAVLGPNLGKNGKEFLNQECKGLKNIYIFVSQENPNSEREVKIDQ